MQSGDVSLAMSTRPGFSCCRRRSTQLSYSAAAAADRMSRAIFLGDLLCDAVRHAQMVRRRRPSATICRPRPDAWRFWGGMKSWVVNVHINTASLRPHTHTHDDCWCDHADTSQLSFLPVRYKIQTQLVIRARCVTLATKRVWRSHCQRDLSLP